MDSRSFIQKISQWLPVAGLLMIISSIPYGWSLYQKISCILFGIGYALYLGYCRPWQNWHWHREYWLYVIMLLLWAMIPVRQLFDPTPPTKYFFFQWHKHEWFLYIGIIGLLGFPDKISLRQVAWVMLATSVFMLLHCISLYWGTDEFAGRSFFFRWDMLRRTHISSHMVMNLYINGALVMGLCAWRTIQSKGEKVGLLIAMLLAWTLILISDGRIGMLGSLIIIGGAIIYTIYRQNRYVGIICGVLVILGSMGILQMHPRMSNEAFKHEPRFAIWDYSWRMVQQQHVCGYGFSTLSEYYVEQAYVDTVMYKGFVEPVIESHPEFAIQGKTMQTHHPHNAFLLYWLGIGLFGLLAFVALFVVAACLPVGDNRTYLWLFLLVLFLQCMTEPVGAHILPQFIAIMLFVFERCRRL